MCWNCHTKGCGEGLQSKKHFDEDGLILQLIVGMQYSITRLNEKSLKLPLPSPTFRLVTTVKQYRESQQKNKSKDNHEWLNLTMVPLPRLGIESIV